MYKVRTSRPQGEATCLDCRRSPEWQAAKRDREREYKKLYKRRYRHGSDAPPERQTHCVVCGEMFTCSLRAHSQVKCEKHRNWKKTKCSTCGIQHYNVNRSANGRQVFCSDSCRPSKSIPIKATNLEWKQCYCGKWVCKQGKLYCSTRCRDDQYRSRRPKRICGDCGTAGLPSRRNYCDQCRDARLHKAKKQCSREFRAKYGKSFRARARHHNVEYERVDRLKVYERDGWRCGICRRKVNRLLKAPHPMSASLDHIVPMSHGGGHLYINCQLAHHRCNSLKSDRHAGDQLALIG